jgi:hypothetical protein
MKINVHIIMGLNEESLGTASYLQRRHEVVYICDESIKGVQKLKEFTHVDQQFIDAIDHNLFKVFVYEPPYKRGQLLRGTKSFTMEKKVKGEEGDQ